MNTREAIQKLDEEKVLAVNIETMLRNLDNRREDARCALQTQDRLAQVPIDELRRFLEDVRDRAHERADKLAAALEISDRIFTGEDK